MKMKLMSRLMLLLCLLLMHAAASEPLHVSVIRRAPPSGHSRETGTKNNEWRITQKESDENMDVSSHKHSSDDMVILYDGFADNVNRSFVVPAPPYTVQKAGNDQTSTQDSLAVNTTTSQGCHVDIQDYREPENGIRYKKRSDFFGQFATKNMHTESNIRSKNNDSTERPILTFPVTKPSIKQQEVSSTVGQGASASSHLDRKRTYTEMQTDNQNVDLQTEATDAGKSSKMCKEVTAKPSEHPGDSTSTKCIFKQMEREKSKHAQTSEENGARSKGRGKMMKGHETQIYGDVLIKGLLLGEVEESYIKGMRRIMARRRPSGGTDCSTKDERDYFNNVVCKNVKYHGGFPYVHMAKNTDKSDWPATIIDELRKMKLASRLSDSSTASDRDGRLTKDLEQLLTKHIPRDTKHSECCEQILDLFTITRSYYFHAFVLPELPSLLVYLQEQMGSEKDESMADRHKLAVLLHGLLAIRYEICTFFNEEAKKYKGEAGCAVIDAKNFKLIQTIRGELREEVLCMLQALGCQGKFDLLHPYMQVMESWNKMRSKGPHHEFDNEMIATVLYQLDDHTIDEIKEQYYEHVRLERLIEVSGSSDIGCRGAKKYKAILRSFRKVEQRLKDASKKMHKLLPLADNPHFKYGRSVFKIHRNIILDQKTADGDLRIVGCTRLFENDLVHVYYYNALVYFTLYHRLYGYDKMRTMLWHSADFIYSYNIRKQEKNGKRHVVFVDEETGYTAHVYTEEVEARKRKFKAGGKKKKQPAEAFDNESKMYSIGSESEDQHGVSRSKKRKLTYKASSSCTH